MTAKQLLLTALPLLLLGNAGLAWAQEEEDAEDKYRWKLAAELGGVWTQGNSESNTTSLALTATKAWARSDVKAQAGGTRTKSAVISRFAEGTVDDYTVTESKDYETTADLYYVRGLYNFNVSERLFVYTGADWLRNVPAGTDSRFLLALGGGNNWADSDKVSFNTRYSFTYTFEEDVVENPFAKANFPGLRVAYGLEYQLTETTDFSSESTVDWNLDNTDDVRIDWANAVSVSVTKKLFLRVGQQLYWRNEPALTDVTLLQGGVDTGEVVPVPLKKLDNLFRLSLVVKI
jgi:putative salt-induced outer membrane protein YdiY